MPAPAQDCCLANKLWPSQKLPTAMQMPRRLRQTPLRCVHRTASCRASNLGFKSISEPTIRRQRKNILRSGAPKITGQNSQAQAEAMNFKSARIWPSIFCLLDLQMQTKCQVVEIDSPSNTSGNNHVGAVCGSACTGHWAVGIPSWQASRTPRASQWALKASK